MGNSITLNGQGTLERGGAFLANVQYNITIREVGTQKEAAGRLTGYSANSPFDAEVAILELENGSRCEVHLTRDLAGQGSVIAVTGPIPGF